MADDKLPSCVAFGMRYWKRLRAKLDKIGSDWMTSKVQKKWFLACYAYEFLHGQVDDYDALRDYKLFVLLGYKLIELLQYVNAVLNNFNNNKEN